MEHGIEAELEPLKWFLRRPDSAWWCGGVVQRVVGGGRQAAAGGVGRRQSTGLGRKEQQELLRVFTGLAGFCSGPRAW